ISLSTIFWRATARSSRDSPGKNIGCAKSNSLPMHVPTNDLPVRNTDKGETVMLGALISQGSGKRTGRRVIATEPKFIVEASFEENTKLAGVDGLNIGTYTASSKPDGSLHGEGEGVFAAGPNDMLTWKGIGVGSFKEGGAVSYRGVLSFTTTSAKL